MSRLATLIVLFFGLMTFTAWADEVEIDALVDRNQISANETFSYSIRVKAGSSVVVDSPRLPNFDGVQLINESRSQSTESYFDGSSFKTSRVVSYNFLLRPLRTGKITIPPAEVVVNGVTRSTKPIVITVTKGSSRLAQPRQRPLNQGLDQFEDQFNQLLQRRFGRGGGGSGGYRSQPVNPKEAFFIQVQTDKTDVYVGEEIRASWYLYTRGTITEIDTLKYPTAKGFWKEDIDLPTQLRYDTEVINGVVYRRALLASYALFPIKPGRSLIDSYKAKCRVLSSQGFGRTRSYEYTKASKEVKVQVKDLPLDRPADFTGAVGVFEVKAGLSQPEVKVNEAVTLKIRFEGRGNAKLIDLNGLDLPPAVELYDSKSEAQFFRDGNSYKQFDFYLIPREVGQVVIPESTISLFDPETEQFYQKKIPEIRFNVVPSDNKTLAESRMDSTDGSATQEASADIQKPLQLDLTWDSSGAGGVMPWVWVGVFTLIFGGLGFQSLSAFGLTQKARSLNEVLAERYVRIEKLAAKEDWRHVGVQVTNSIYFTLGQITGQGGAEEIDKLLQKAPPSLRNECGEDLTKTLSQFEFLGFAPEEVVPQERKTKTYLKKEVAQAKELLMKSVRLGIGGDDASSSSS